MRKIEYIAIHCTATSQDATIESIQNFWKKVKGWKSPGYHFIIKPNGEVVNLLPIEEVSNGVQGFNSQTINIAYIGGVDGELNPIDNRTPEQIESMLKKINELKVDFPNAIIQGHRDFPNVKKDCPSFNVKKWLNHEGRNSKEGI
jgi:N-acetylmuramoyl-L-alanine amidase